MKIDLLLSRLEKVRQRGPGAWIACCPAHDDRNPSMTISERDGVIAMHCFTGCDVVSITEAVGMDLSDLFPDKPVQRGPLRQRFMPADVLACLSGELHMIAMCARAMADGEQLTEADRGRLKAAAKRFEAAREAAGR